MVVDVVVAVDDAAAGGFGGGIMGCELEPPILYVVGLRLVRSDDKVLDANMESILLLDSAALELLYEMAGGS